MEPLWGVGHEQVGLWGSTPLNYGSILCTAELECKIEPLRHKSGFAVFEESLQSTLSGSFHSSESTVWKLRSALPLYQASTVIFLAVN